MRASPVRSARVKAGEWTSNVHGGMSRRNSAGVARTLVWPLCVAVSTYGIVVL